MELPTDMKHKIWRTWAKSESEALRRNRLLRQNDCRTIKIGAYQVIKVLGKLNL